MKTYLLAAAASILFTGCSNLGPEFIDEMDLIYTNFSPSFNFQAQRTYYLPDSVVFIQDDLEPGELPEMVNPLFADRILQRLRSNLNRLGWTQVNDYMAADVVLFPSASKTVVVNYWYNWGMWGWGFPGWGWGWGWAYPGFFPPTVTTHRTGTFFVQMAYTKEIDANGYMPVMWTLVVDGLFEGTTQGILNRIDFTTDQGFTQSPYLNINAN
ncbi:MAG: DUF4136 domain-containing protein [Flavobacteriales bacterium]|nr:DUF4136 domain-containing protein [Flavobacteriales bacterium]